MNKWIKFSFGILISIILLYIVFRNVDVKSILAVLKTAKYEYLIYAMGINVFMLWLRSYRWRMFVPKYKSSGVSKFFESTNVGLMFNVVLPFRAGDLVQAYLLSKKIGQPKALTFSTVLMERFIDFFPPVIFIIIGSFFIILPQEISIPMAVLVLLILVVGIIILIKLKSFILKKLEFYSRGDKRSALIEKIFGITKNFYSGIENFKDIKLLIKIIPLTLLLWTGYSITMWLYCRTLDIPLPSVWASFLIQSVTALSVVIPSSPGFIGTWEFMAILSLKIFSIEKTLSLTFALISHIFGMLPVVLIGAFYVLKEFTLIKSVSKETG